MSQQKSGLVPGILVGLLAMIVGAGIYGAIIGLTGYEIRIVTIGIGILVGLGIVAVKPTSPVLPPLAAVMGLAGAALGQILGASILLSADDTLTVGFGDALNLVVSNFSTLIGDDPKSLIFWAIGAYAAFAFVNKRVKAAHEIPVAAPEAAPAGIPADAGASADAGALASTRSPCHHRCAR